MGLINNTAKSSPPDGVIKTYMQSALGAPVTAATEQTPPPPQVGKPAAKTAGVTNWNVAKEQTVEGRLPGLIEANSPIMQLADTRAKQKANAYGLMNSSLAVGAGQAAVLDAATGIATSDANTLARSGEFNANAANQVGMFNAGEGNKFTLADADREFQSNESLLGRNFNQGENALDRTFRSNESEADRALTRGENALGRDFTASQSGLDRTWRTGESAADRASNSSIAGMQAGASVSAASIRANADTANAAADRVWRTGESAADRAARADESASSREFQQSQTKDEQTWRTDMSKSERGDVLFRDATSQAAAIDRDPDLSAEAKAAAKYEVFKNTEEYGTVQGLNLDLNFSDQYAPPTAEEKAAEEQKRGPMKRDGGSNYDGSNYGDGSGGNGGSGGDNGSGGSGTSGSGQGGDGPGGGW